MKEEINYNREGNQFTLKLFINGIQVNTETVQTLNIREWIFDKTLTMDCIFYDNGMFVEVSPLYESCPISLELSINEEEKIVKEFEMGPFETNRTAADNGVIYSISFVAFLKSNLFKSASNRVFRSKNVSTILKEVMAGESFQLKVEKESNDVQTWYQMNENNFDFINHLMKRSFVNEEDMPLLFMTKDNMVYTSLKYICEKDVKFYALNNRHEMSNNRVDQTMKGDEKIRKIYYNINIASKNIASIQNKDAGYGVMYSNYDYKDFLYKYVNFNYAPMSQYMNRKKGNISVVNSITYNSTSSNTHSNYLLAKTQNIYMENIFFNNYKQINVRPDLTISLGDKIYLEVPDSVGRILNKSGTDKVNSGEYIIGGIMHNLNKGGIYNMVLTLFRNGLNDSDVKDKILELEESNEK